MVQQDIISFLKFHKEEISIKFHVSRLGLFGSFARNESTTESDVDILYDLDASATNIYQLKKEFKSYLESELHRPIDLCRIKYMKPFVKDIIEQEAIYV
jgi:predicted nucleotidyltransferase